MNSKMAPEDAVVFGSLLDRWAEQRPDKDFVVFEEGGAWTYSKLRQVVNKVANAFKDLGVDHGHRVVSLQPTGREALRTWFGLNRIGAVYVPINVAFRGRILEDAINNVGATIAVVHPEMVPHLAALSLSSLKTLIVPRAEGISSRLDIVPGTIFDTARDEKPLTKSVRGWDLQTIIYTSGTTGRSKGVLSSYYHLYEMATNTFDYGTESDRYLVDLPMFHASSTTSIYAAIVRGGSIALMHRFRTEGYWKRAKETQSTICLLPGTTTALLASAPRSASDRDHGIRFACCIPLMSNALDFSDRFGVTVKTIYNLTETSTPIRSGKDIDPVGSCGVVRPGVELRIVDPYDREVPVGEVGEAIVRADVPWSMSHGYDNAPEATAEAWRNGWFHTGDLLRKDSAGHYYYVDRRKDALRRRGENISSIEIEREILSYPDIAEAVVVGVASAEGEQDVLAAVVPKPFRKIDPSNLFEFLRPKMAHFMLPRYIRVCERLPMTPTSKVEKFVVRNEGVTVDTWDREKAGIIVKSDRLTPT